MIQNSIKIKNNDGIFFDKNMFSLKYLFYLSDYKNQSIV